MSEWKPVEDGEYDSQHIIDSCIVDGDWLTVQEHVIGSDDIQVAAIALPDDIRLCRRVPASRDLLAACEAYLQIIDMPIPDKIADANAWADKRAAAVEQMRAAVAKAKGDS